MDTDLDKLFQLSVSAALPEVKAPVLKALLEEPVPEESAKLSRRAKAKAQEEPKERLRRTLFVGNVPIDCCKSKKLQRELKKVFGAHGKVVSIRFRSLGFSKALPRKIAFLTEQFHEDRDSANAYIVMESEEAARKALVLNATVFEGKHLRVDLEGKGSDGDQEGAPGKTKKNDTKRSVFVGNLPFSVSEEALWDFFSTCGQVTNVRIIRDRKTNMGKGFGYVAFADKASIELALQLAGEECAGRPVRISKCTKEGFHKETVLHRLKRKAAKEAEPPQRLKETLASKAKVVKTAAGYAKKCASVAPSAASLKAKAEKKSAGKTPAANKKPMGSSGATKVSKKETRSVQSKRPAKVIKKRTTSA